MSDEADLITDVTPNMEDEEIIVDEDIDDVSEEVSLSDLKLESSLEGGSSKPICKTNTEAEIVSLSIKRHNEKNWTRKGDDWYYPLSVSIECKLKDGQTTFDNYSGLRETSTGNLWCGEKSQFGKLVTLVKEETGAKDFKEVFDYLEAGRRVKIKTEESSFNDKTYQKNLIKQFL